MISLLFRVQSMVGCKGESMKGFMFIMRGLPGSGKSVAAYWIGGTICSADHFFTKNGRYVFDPKMLFEAHEACMKKARDACEREDRVVVIDNTNIKVWNFQYYLNLAETHGYKVQIIDMYDSGKTDEQLFQRNLHEVPLDTITRMRRDWEKFPS